MKRVERPHLFEAIDRRSERLRSLFIKQETGLARHHDFSRAAPSESDNRSTTGLSLNQGDTDIFFPGEHKAFGLLQITDLRFLRYVTRESDIGRCARLQLRQVRTVSDDDQATTRHSGKRVDYDIDALI